MLASMSSKFTRLTDIIRDAFHISFNIWIREVHLDLHLVLSWPTLKGHNRLNIHLEYILWRIISLEHKWYFHKKLLLKYIHSTWMKNIISVKTLLASNDILFPSIFFQIEGFCSNFLKFYLQEYCMTPLMIGIPLLWIVQAIL